MKMKTIRKNAATGKIYAKSIPTACRPDQQHNNNALAKPMLNSSSNHSIIIQKLGSSRSHKYLKLLKMFLRPRMKNVPKMLHSLEIQKILKKGCPVECDREKGHFISTFFKEKKRDDSFQTILYVKYKHIKMESLSDALNFFHSTCHYCTPKVFHI